MLAHRGVPANAKKVLLPPCLIWSGPVGYKPLDYKLNLSGETAKAKKSGTGSELAGYMEDWGKGSQYEKEKFVLVASYST